MGEKETGTPRRRGKTSPVAVVDIGSNSARVVVYRMDPEGQLRIVASTRAGLRLVGDVDQRGTLGAKAAGRVLEALRDFRGVSRGAGARTVEAVGTAAIRDATDGPALLTRVRRELGVRIRILSGDEEARYGFLGGIRGLPVQKGLLFDMGGGSLQVTHFAQRTLQRTWSLPLGALRLSRAYLGSDPPRHRELRALGDHVRETLAAAGIPRLVRGETLVGTGGTVRNLAKVDRERRSYPIKRIHGYALRRTDLDKIAHRLVSNTQEDRGHVPGLSDERADSIAGGAAGLSTLLHALRAREVIVSGMGVREGIAYAACSGRLPEPEEVAASSLRSLCSRFRDYDHAASQRRSALAKYLEQRLAPRDGTEVSEALVRAATVLDIGRSVDFFDRHRHAADIALEAELNGLSHRQIALVSAIVRVAGDPGADRELYSPLLDEVDWGPVARAGALLALADDIERRCDPRLPIGHSVHVRGRRVALAVKGLIAWQPHASTHRFEGLFGKELTVEPSGGS